MIPHDHFNKAFLCECGREHWIPIQTIEIGEDALDHLEQFLASHQFQSILILDDAVTGSLLGDRVKAALSNHPGLSVSDLQFPAAEHLHADQEAILAATSAIALHRPDVVIAVGSGTLTDIARYASFSAELPFVVVATAPSVDGYASTVAALQFNGVKLTKPAQAPLAIFALPSVLAEAPFVMLQSGFGDLVGKLTALMDWKLARFFYAEDWCQASYELVANALTDVVDAAEQLALRDQDAVTTLFEGLVKSGIAMAMMGNSRPASGSEHHLSHYWDFVTYLGHRPYVAHGIQVGYASHFTLDLYQRLNTLPVILPPMLPQLDDAWEADIRTRWGTGAEDIIDEQRAKLLWLTQHFDPTRWEGVDGHGLVEALSPEIHAITRTQAALTTMEIPRDLGRFFVSVPILQETLSHAHEVRARYTILDWLDGQGIRDQMVQSILDEASAADE